jgi:hypothetical protein
VQLSATRTSITIGTCSLVIATFATVTALAERDGDPDIHSGNRVAAFGGWEDNPREGVSDTGSGAVALVGTLTGATSLDANDVFAFVTPKQAIEAHYEEGDSVSYFRLPDRTIRIDGDQYSLVVDPADLPDWTISETGLVTFHVLVQDDSTSQFGETSASVRATYDKDGSLMWIDPLASADASDSMGDDENDGSSASADDPSESEPVSVTADLTATIDGVLCDGDGCADRTSPEGVPHVDVDLGEVSGEVKPESSSRAGRTTSLSLVTSVAADEEGADSLDVDGELEQDDEITRTGCGDGDPVVPGRTRIRPRHHRHCLSCRH